MNPRELVNHIRSGPTELVLDKPLGFRLQTPSNPCNFNEILEALQSSETIRDVKISLVNDISEEEWVLPVKTLGRIKDIRSLSLTRKPNSHNFHLSQAVAIAVNSAHSLRKLEVYIFPSEPCELMALANALQQHTALQELEWNDIGPWREAAPRDLSVDTVLRSLPACPHLQKVHIMTERASADALKELLQMHSATELRLVLKTDQWLAVADEIRQGRCNVQRLDLSMLQGTLYEATEAVQALASAIQTDHNLTDLLLDVKRGFTDEAGVALAEALTVNITLLTVSLMTTARNSATLSVPAYEAFSAMLRVNTSLVLLNLPWFETADADERLCESRDQMRIEQRLNAVGRGRLLASEHTRREQWAFAMHQLNSWSIDDDSAPVVRLYSDQFVSYR